MAAPLKNIYNIQFFQDFSRSLENVLVGFDSDLFMEQIFNQEWENLELKGRMHHISITLSKHLPNDYKKAIDRIFQIIDEIKKEQTSLGFEYMFFPDFVEQYGLNDLDTSIEAMEKITQFTSCEFAIRPFIIEYHDKMIKQLLNWSQHKHAMVRRLASEGCRPRLPWAMAIPSLKNNASPILPILENLKNDVSESVRRSVANNLNDISKDNPKTVIDLVKKWQGTSNETDWLIKHACRTLLKQGNLEVLEIFGFIPNDQIKMINFKIQTPKVKIGNFLEFSFKIVNTGNLASKIRLEYGLYYQKSNGSLSKKVFKISEKEYAENSVTSILRKQSFKLITTRKFHLGRHQVSIIVNGKEFERNDFELVK